MRWPRPAFLRKIFVFVLWACEGTRGSRRADERRSGAGVDHHGAAAGLDLGPAERELVRHGHDLVRHDDGDLEGLGELLELAEVRVQRLLALRELAAARELRAEVRHDAVDDDEAVLALARLRELARGVLEALALLLEVGRARGGDVVQALVGVDARGLGDLDEALRAEGVVLRGARGRRRRAARGARAADGRTSVPEVRGGAGARRAAGGRGDSEERGARAVSMKSTRPAAPPSSWASWALTQSVSASCVLPEPASPKISVMVPSSIPPPMSASKAAEPVVICDAGGRHFHLRAR